MYSVEGTTNDFLCYVYKGNTPECFDGDVVDAVNNLIDWVRANLKVTLEEAIEIIGGGYHQSLEEFSDWCVRRGLPNPDNTDGDWVGALGDWHLFCMPQAPVGAVRGFYFWSDENAPTYKIELLNGVQAICLE
jgi:hypothetical protein